MNDRAKQILPKIIEEIQIGMNILGESELEEFLANEMQKRAIGMTSINIGELVKHLPDEFSLEYKNVPWKEVSGFSDIAAHQHKTQYMEDVFKAMRVDFPNVLTQIEAILKNDAENKQK